MTHEARVSGTNLYECLWHHGDSNIDSSYRYNNRQGNQFWHSVCTAQLRELYALGTIHNDLYIIGGQMKLKNQYHITNCVEKYSMEQDNWRTVAPLSVPLACHAVVTVKNRLFVMGGWTPQVRNLAENFNVYGVFTLYCPLCFCAGLSRCLFVFKKLLVACTAAWISQSSC